MERHHDPLSPRSLVAATVTGLVATVLGGVIAYRLTERPAAPGSSQSTSSVVPAVALPS